MIQKQSISVLYKLIFYIIHIFAIIAHYIIWNQNVTTSKSYKVNYFLGVSSSFHAHFRFLSQASETVFAAQGLFLYSSELESRRN